MLKISTLKKNVIEGTTDGSLIIFLNTENDIIATQYINKIAETKNLEKVAVLQEEDFKLTSTLFDNSVENYLQILRIDNFKGTNEALLNAKNVIISCNKISKAARALFEDYIVEIPKLDEWQIMDYICTQLEGLTEKDAEWLITRCNYDKYRIFLEVDRLKIFPPAERSFMLELFKEDFVYSDLCVDVIYTFVDAVIAGDLETIKRIYPEISKMDSSPLGITALLYNNLKNTIRVLAGAGNNGVPSYIAKAIIEKPMYYKDKKASLVALFKAVANVDKLLKTGKLEINSILDYILVNILV